MVVVAYAGESSRSRRALPVVLAPAMGPTIPDVRHALPTPVGHAGDRADGIVSHGGRWPEVTFPALSVLDLVPVRSDQATGDAIAASRSLARTADAAGYTRYWVAEHHNMPAVAATNPPVLIAMLASATERIRVGSGGVMLPNHEPLVVAEQFALLEAAFPGRIDLGIGRAPGTDPLTRYVLRGGSSAAADDAVTRFPEYVDDIITLMHPDGVEMMVGGRRQPLRATPRSASVPTVWLLGSSDYSARLAASRGLPYVFAHHFAGQGTAEAIALYRSSYQPSEAHPEPRTFLTVNAAVAETAQEARRLALPQALQMLALRTGAPLTPQRLVEEAETTEVPDAHAGMVEAMLSRWVVDEPGAARRRVEELATEFGVDEVMVHPVASAVAGTAASASPAREETLRLLAG
jgi:luciferase family oxidoreductase group 1